MQSKLQGPARQQRRMQLAWHDMALSLPPSLSLMRCRYPHRTTFTIPPALPASSPVLHQLLHEGGLALPHQPVQRDQRLQRSLQMMGQQRAAAGSSVRKPAAAAAAASAAAAAGRWLPAIQQTAEAPLSSTHHRRAHQPVCAVLKAAVQLEDDVQHVAPRPARVHRQLQGCSGGLGAAARAEVVGRPVQAASSC